MPGEQAKWQSAPDHIYAGCTVEDQVSADKRRSAMKSLSSYGWKTFVSYEPALSFVRWSEWYFMQWLICGGESGNHARAMNPQWARAARDYCVSAKISFFFKQWGEYAPYTALAGMDKQTRFRHKPQIWEDGTLSFRVGKMMAGCALDGREWKEMV